jgi:putative protease
MEVKVGTIAHYYSRLGVAIVELTDQLKVGDQVHVKGHSSDFTQPVGSMQIEHQSVLSAEAGNSIGLKVIEHAREGDDVFKVLPE